MFKNLVLFRFDPLAVGKLLPDLSTLIGEFALKPIAAQQMSVSGFLPVIPGMPHLTAEFDQATFLHIGTEKRVLPPNAVEREVEKRIAKIESESGNRLGGKARRELADNVMFEMLPRALTVMDKQLAFIDMKMGLFAVATGSRKSAESSVALVRSALGSFPVESLAPEEAPSVTLTRWLLDQALPEGYEFGDELVLKDVAQGGSIRATKEDITSDEIRAHITSGRFVSRLAIQKPGQLSVLLADDLVVRKLVLEVKDEQLDAAGDNSAATAFDTAVFIALTNLRALVTDFSPLFGPRVITPQPQLQRPLPLAVEAPQSA